LATRYFALLFGIVFLAVGILGFVPGVMTMPQAPQAGDVAVNTDFGRLLGLFPVNVLHNLVHVLFGIWGLAAYRSYGAARTYGRAVAIIYAVFTVMGLIPGLNTTFGLVPLYGNDVWLHALLAIVAAYFGFVSRDAGVAGDTTTAGTTTGSYRH
jgi:hypothetical protein